MVVSTEAVTLSHSTLLGLIGLVCTTTLKIVDNFMFYVQIDLQSEKDFDFGTRIFSK